jgi:3-oxoadipate enol-lactonase
VLLHGFGLDLTSWDPQVPEVGSAYRTVRYDLRGFGGSSPPVAGRGHVDDLRELLDRLGITSAHLVGLSLGANVALASALELPDVVASLVLASSGLPGHVWTTPRPPDEAAAYAHRHGVDAGRRFWLDHPVFAPARRLPHVRAHLERMVADYSGWEWRTELPQTDLLPALHDRLAEITAPTLVLSGGLDVPGYHEIAHLLARGIPGAAQHELPTAGHMMNLERPEEFTALLLGFLSGVGQ